MTQDSMAFLVQYRVDGETAFETDYARELSEEGMWLETGLDVGTVVQVRLPLTQGNELMERLGRIDEANEQHRFVRFIDGTDADRETISLSVQTRDTIEFPTEDLLYPPSYDDEDETLPG
jgi:hypothetical protein